MIIIDGDGSASFFVQTVTWQGARERLRAIRRVVFIEEQHVPEALEWDDLDERCQHVLAFAVDGSEIGTGRISPEGRIGRMAVLKAWRRQGVGGAVLEHLLALARTAGHGTVILHAQTHAMAFYARHGFKPEGPEFLEADIPHRVMTTDLGGA